ncbi:proline iminopeptidase-family hydrolase [Pseudomonas gingeri]
MEFNEIREGFAHFGPYQTWYRVTGDLANGRTPLVILHGGPGCTHDYVDAFKDIAASGHAVVHYDQLGNGKSTHLPHQDPSFWTVQLFLDELDNLLDHLGIRQHYVLLGQSWGGMLASEHAVRQPAGLKAMILANSPSCMRTWVSEANRLREQLPAAVQQALLKHEQARTYNDPEYVEASRAFYDRHVCRITPWPDEVARTFAQVDADPTVYHTMSGPTEFHVIGSLKDWTIIDRLHLVKVPTLVISGRHDEATEAVVRPYVEKIAGARWALFEDSSHMPHVEERQACMGTVVQFLDESL